MKTARLLTIAFCIITLFSCRSHKEATQPGSLTPGNAAALEQAVHTINSNRQTAECLTSRMNLTASVAGGKKISIGGSIKMKRNDVIQISLVALGIMEVGRMELTQDYLLVVDRTGRKYVKVHYTDIPDLKKAGIDFFTFQSLFWDELFLPGDKGVAPAPERFNKMLDGDNIKLNYTEPELATLTFLANTLNGMVSETAVSAVGKEESPVLQWQYSDYEKVDKQSFPTRMKIMVNGSKPVEATFTFNNIRQDSKWETRTTLSKKYSEIPLESIMGKLFGSSLSF